MTDLFLSSLANYHQSQGASLGEYHGALVPKVFQDPVAEHQAVRRAAGLFDFAFRAKFSVKGEDRVRFLQGMVSNDVKKLSAGQGTYATLLNPRGHILADLRIYCTGDYFLVDTDADLREKAIQTLRRYIIADRVDVEPLDLPALSFQGPRSRGLLEKTLHIDLPDLEEFGHIESNYAGFPIRVVRASSTGEEGYEIWGSANSMLPLWGAACGQAPTYEMLACGTQALETLRIEAGIPRYGQELGEDMIPLEAGLLNALSFNKGCYIGQEILERARSRGRVNWKLVGLVVDSPQPPPVGEKVIVQEKQVGEVTSGCISPTLGKTIALSYVRREISEGGTRLVLASGAPAEVIALPFYARPSNSTSS